MRVRRRRALQVTGISKCKGPEAGRAHLRNSKKPAQLPDGEWGVRAQVGSGLVRGPRG